MNIGKTDAMECATSGEGGAAETAGRLATPTRAAAPAVADTINATKVEVVCPHCNEAQAGWLCDPRGQEGNCDDCGEPYIVANDATIRIS